MQKHLNISVFFCILHQFSVVLLDFSGIWFFPPSNSLFCNFWSFASSWIKTIKKMQESSGNAIESSWKTSLLHFSDPVLSLSLHYWVNSHNSSKNGCHILSSYWVWYKNYETYTYIRRVFRVVGSIPRTPLRVGNCFQQ